MRRTAFYNRLRPNGRSIQTLLSAVAKSLEARGNDLYNGAPLRSVRPIKLSAIYNARQTGASNGTVVQDDDFKLKSEVSVFLVQMYS